MYPDVYDYDQANEMAATSIADQPDAFAVVDDLTCYCREYARQKPEVVALWCFGIGFVLGWKLKPW